MRMTGAHSAAFHERPHCAARPGSVRTRKKTADHERFEANHRCPRPATRSPDRFRCLDRFANPRPPHPAA